MHSSVEVRPIGYSEIIGMCKYHLWKDRVDPIKPMSSMVLDGGFDMKIYEKYQPFFFGLFVDHQLVGVNSCHLSQEGQMRSRGLFVDEGCRGRGFAQRLLAAVEQVALDQGCSLIWSYPRLTSLSTYQKFGFSLYAETVPASRDHVYAVKRLTSNQ